MRATTMLLWAALLATPSWAVPIDPAFEGALLPVGTSLPVGHSYDSVDRLFEIRSDADPNVVLSSGRILLGGIEDVDGLDTFGRYFRFFQIEVDAGSTQGIDAFAIPWDGTFDIMDPGSNELRNRALDIDYVGGSGGNAIPDRILQRPAPCDAIIPECGALEFVFEFDGGVAPGQSSGLLLLEHQSGFHWHGSVFYIEGGTLETAGGSATGIPIPQHSLPEPHLAFGLTAALLAALRRR